MELLQPQTHTQILVPDNKARYLEEISKLSVESLQILAEKSRKAGIEQKLKQFKHFI